MRTDRASRLIDAPLAILYRAFIDPEALVRWLPPEGMTGEMLAFDAKAGGGYRMALRYDDEDAEMNAKVLSKDIVATATQLKAGLTK